MMFKIVKYIRTSPNKESIKIMNNADIILKDWKNNYIMMNHLIKSVLIKKSNELNFENYKIKLMTFYHSSFEFLMQQKT